MPNGGWLRRRWEGVQDAVLGTLVVASLGTAMTLAVLFWGKFAGLPPAWIHGAAGALTAFAVVALVCVLMMAVRARQRRTLERLRRAAEQPAAKGFIDFLVDKDRAERQFLPILGRITQDITWIGQRMGTYTARLDAYRARGAMNPTQGQRLATEAAADMRAVSGRLEDSTQSFENTVDLLTASYLGYMQWFQPSSDAQRQELRGFREALGTLRQTVTDGITLQRGFRISVESLRTISQDVNAAGVRMTRVLDALIAVMEKLVARIAEIDVVIAQKVNT